MSLFFHKYLDYFLNKAGFKCPIPIETNNGKTIIRYKDKNLMIVSFLEGTAKNILTPEDCNSIGHEVAKMHEITKNFKIQRDNNLSINYNGLITVRSNF